MKTILTLLLTCVASFAATTYPVITDNANRQFTGGATNLSLLNGTNVFGGTNRYTGTVIITNAASTLSGNGAGMTNLSAGNIASGSLDDARLSSNVPLINGTNVFTGTNTFTASKFFPANALSRRLLLFTNINNRVDAFTNAVAPTGPGGYANCGKIATFTMPPLLGKNSLLYISYQVDKTNATASSYTPMLYAGSQTNWVSYLVALSASSTPQTFFTSIANSAFANAGSFTNQYQNSGSMTANTQLPNPTNCVDTSVPWTLYFGATSTSGATNVLVMNFFVEELVVP